MSFDLVMDGSCQVEECVLEYYKIHYHFSKSRVYFTGLYVKILPSYRMNLKCQQEWELVQRSPCWTDLVLSHHFLITGSKQRSAKSKPPACGQFFLGLHFSEILSWLFFMRIILPFCQHLSDSRGIFCHLDSTGSLEFILYLRLIVWSLQVIPAA